MKKKKLPIYLMLFLTLLSAISLYLVLMDKIENHETWRIAFSSLGFVAFIVFSSLLLAQSKKRQS